MVPLTSDASYNTLVGQPSREGCGTLVVPGNADQSYLVHKLTDNPPCSGLRMPRGGNIMPQPLPAQDIAAVRAWIQAGAPR